MKRRSLVVFLIVFAVVAIVLIAAADWFYPRLDLGKSRQQPRPAPSAPAAMGGSVLRFESSAPQLAYLKVLPAEASPEPLIEALSGRVAYDENRTSRVSAPIAGRVTRIVAQLGERVARGAPLAFVDAPDYAQATADLKRDEIDVKQQRAVYERAKLLFEGEVMSRKEFEVAETGLRESEVELGRARRRLEALGQSGGATPTGDLVLRASVAGVITERNISPGTQVGPDATKPLFVISDPEKLWIVVDLPEQHLGVLEAGQVATVEVDAYPGKSFRATVVNVGDVLDPATRRVQVRCAVDNSERLLKPEMYARVTPLAAKSVPRARIPNTALVSVGVGNYVFVEREPGVLERRKVVLSVQGRDQSWVRDGIVPGDRVVVSGALLLNAELQGN